MADKPSEKCATCGHPRELHSLQSGCIVSFRLTKRGDPMYCECEAFAHSPAVASLKVLSYNCGRCDFQTPNDEQFVAHIQAAHPSPEAQAASGTECLHPLDWRWSVEKGCADVNGFRCAKCGRDVTDPTPPAPRKRQHVDEPKPEEPGEEIVDRFIVHSWPDALNIPSGTCDKGDDCEYASLHLAVATVSRREASARPAPTTREPIRRTK